SRGRARDRSPRADAGACLARGGVHGRDPGRGRVPRPRGRMSAVSATASWAAGLRVTPVRVLRSEWTKLRSLRSTRWSLLIGVILPSGLSCAFAAIPAARWSHMSIEEQLNRHPVEIATAGVNLSQLAIGVLGVLVISGEYSTGMIRASMGAVPRRLPVL